VSLYLVNFVQVDVISEDTHVIIQEVDIPSTWKRSLLRLGLTFTSNRKGWRFKDFPNDSKLWNQLQEMIQNFDLRGVQSTGTQQKTYMLSKMAQLSYSLGHKTWFKAQQTSEEWLWGTYGACTSSSNVILFHQRRPASHRHPRIEHTKIHVKWADLTWGSENASHPEIDDVRIPNPRESTRLTSETQMLLIGRSTRVVGCHFRDVRITGLGGKERGYQLEKVMSEGCCEPSRLSMKDLVDG